MVGDTAAEVRAAAQALLVLPLGGGLKPLQCDFGSQTRRPIAAGTQECSHIPCLLAQRATQCAGVVNLRGATKPRGYAVLSKKARNFPSKSLHVEATSERCCRRDGCD